MTTKNCKTRPARQIKATAGIEQTREGPNNVLSVPKDDDEAEALAVARAILGPDFRHGMAASQLLKSHFGGPDSAPGLGDFADAMREGGNKAAKGDREFASRMLAAQATTLDAIFAEMARRMALNMGDYLGATETYARIALKAQANSRATLEALAKLHQPREQTVRHVHVNEGGQAIIADQFHNHTGGQRNEKIDDQSQATEAAGAIAALPCPDPFGNGMPVPSRSRKTTMQDARRE